MAKKRKNNRKIFTLIGFVVLILIAIVIWVLVWNDYFGEKPQNDVRDEVEEAEIVETPTNKDEKEEDVVRKDEIRQFDGEDPNKLAELTGAISYLAVVNGELVVRTNIDQFLTNGECKIELYNNGNLVFFESVGVVGLVSTSTCEGFNMKNNFGSGKYEILISVTSGEKHGIIKGEIDL